MRKYIKKKYQLALIRKQMEDDSLENLTEKLEIDFGMKMRFNTIISTQKGMLKVVCIFLLHKCVKDGSITFI